jgi:hypothetical protein
MSRALGCSPATAHRRLVVCQKAGLWELVHRELVRRLNPAGRIDWSVAVIVRGYICALQAHRRPGHRRLIVPARTPSNIC